MNLVATVWCAEVLSLDSVQDDPPAIIEQRRNLDAHSATGSSVVFLRSQTSRLNDRTYKRFILMKPDDICPRPAETLPGIEATKPLATPITLTTVWQCGDPAQTDALLGGRTRRVRL